MNQNHTLSKFADQLAKLAHVKQATVDAAGDCIRVHYSHTDVDFQDDQWTAKMQHAYKQLGPIHGVRVVYSEVDARWACFTLHVITEFQILVAQDLCR